MWTTSGPYGGNIIELAICPSNSQVIFASTGNYWAGRSGGVFKTTDGGENWQRTDFSEVLTRCFAFDIQNPSVLYAGTVGDGIFKSMDGGSTWAPACDGLGNLNVKSLVINPLDGYTLFAGTEDGIYKTSDGGVKWLATSLTEVSVTSLAIHPTGPDTLFAATFMSGLYKSIDGGDSWFSVGTNLPDWINCLALAPSEPRTIYANGYRSTDAGKSWEPSIPESEFIRALEIDSRDADIVYAGTGFFTTGNYSFGWVYKSTDGGMRWDRMDNGMPHLPVWCLALDPIAPDTLYAGTDATGIFVSYDQAKHWNHLETGVWSLGVGDLAFVHPDSAALFAATSGGIFRSTDHGQSWRLHSNGLTHLQTVALGTSPSCPSTIYTGTGWAVTRNFFKSTDGGFNWGALGGFKGVYDIEVNPLNCNTLYVAAIDGLAKSADGGSTWTYFSMPIYRLAIDPFDTNTVYAGDYYSGIYKTTNGGEDWHQMNAGLTNLTIGSIVIDPSHSEILYVATHGGGVFKSVDAGTTWHSSSEGLTNYEVLSLALDPVEPDRVYAGTKGGGVFRSMNNGETWEEMNNGLKALKVVSLVVDPTDHATIHAGTVEEVAGVWSYTISDLGIDSHDFSSEYPKSYTLSQNYPNPFNPETSIQYSVISDQSPANSIQYSVISDQSPPHTTLKIYNILGQEVRTLVDEVKEPGHYTVTWDGKDERGDDVASGVYFYRLSVNGAQWLETKKMVLLR